MDMISANLSAQETVQKVLDAVPSDAWDRISRCPEWTLRDVAAHLIWGRTVLHSLAGGGADAGQWGAPGSTDPGSHLEGADPAARFREACAELGGSLDEDSLEAEAPEFLRAMNPNATLRHFVGMLLGDQLAHAWDIGSVVGVAVEPDPDTLADVMRDTREPIRAPGMFGAAVDMPPDAADFDRFLANFGRDPRAD